MREEVHKYREGQTRSAGRDGPGVQELLQGGTDQEFRSYCREGQIRSSRVIVRSDRPGVNPY